MTTLSTTLTYQDYLLLPEDGKRYEIIEGDLSMTPAPLTRHQTMVGRIHYQLMAYLETHTIGDVFIAPCDVLLSDTDVVQPDLLVVLHSGRACITENNIQGPPDLVVEILSPSTATRDRELKRKRYEHFGVREYWLVDPADNTLEILNLTTRQRSAYSLATHSPHHCSTILLPDFTLDLTWLFK